MFKLNLVTPEKKLVTDQELVEITLPAHAGELNILPGHAPLMTTLTAGILRYQLKNGEAREFAIGWGYCQVSAEGVTVLAENAMSAEEIETETVEDHLKQQVERLLNENLSEEDYQRVQREMARLQAELNIVKEARH